MEVLLELKLEDKRGGWRSIVGFGAALMRQFVGTRRGSDKCNFFACLASFVAQSRPISGVLGVRRDGGAQPAADVVV